MGRDAPVSHALAPGALLGCDAAARGAGLRPRHLPACGPLLPLASPGRHRVIGRAVVVIVVGGGEPRGVDDEVARGGAAHGDDGRGEENKPDDRRLNHRR